VGGDVARIGDRAVVLGASARRVAGAAARATSLPVFIPDLGANMTTAMPDIRVLDADTYAHGDPTTFGLPLDQYAYLRDEEPCYLHEFNDPILIDRALAAMTSLYARTATWASPPGPHSTTRPTALGWTVLATGPGTRFTIDSTGHGMFVNIETVQGF
jgi:hypothetical protein